MTLDLVLKSTFLVLLAAGIARALHGHSAPWRHLVWRSAYLALLLLPIAGAVLTWQLRVLPRPVETDVADSEPIVSVAAPKTACCSIDPSPAPALEAPTAPPLSGEALLTGAWLSGIVLALIRIGYGLGKLRILARRSTTIRGIVRRSGSDDPQSAIALGLLHPIVLLPLASTDWSPSRRRMVVLHEFAHVRRLDFASNLLAELACALYWFNPLVWLGARAMRAEAESAADDEVLAAGVRASDYASELLRMSVDLAPRPGHTPLVGASPMVQPKIESRLQRILSPSIRRRGVTTLPTLLVVLAGLALSGVIAGVRIAHRQPPTRPSDEAKLAAERMRNLGIATMLYAMDYDEVLPNAASTEAARKIVHPYLKSDASYQSPTTGGRIVYNTSLSGRKLKSFASPEQVPTWIEILPNPSDSFGVAFVDGHYALIPPTDPTAAADAPVKFQRVGAGPKTERWELKRGARVFATFPQLANANPQTRSIDVTSAQNLATARSLVANAKPVFGSSISRTKVVAFFDYQCPACRRADQSVQTAIQKADSVALYYREYPLRLQHPLAVPAAILSMKARQKGPFAFAAVHAELLKGEKLDSATLQRVQRQFGLSGKMTDEVKKALDEDSYLAGCLVVTFVPSYVVIEGSQVKIMNRVALLQHLRAN